MIVPKEELEWWMWENVEFCYDHQNLGCLRTHCDYVYTDKCRMMQYLEESGKIQEASERK